MTNTTKNGQNWVVYAKLRTGRVVLVSDSMPATESLKFANFLSQQAGISAFARRSRIMPGEVVPLLLPGRMIGETEAKAYKALKAGGFARPLKGGMIETRAGTVRGIRAALAVYATEDEDGAWIASRLALGTP